MSRKFLNFVLYTFLALFVLINDVDCYQCKTLKNSRLSSNVIPHHYDLNMEFDLETLDMYGIVRISIEVKKNTHSITLHSKQLEISSAKFTDHSGTEIRAFNAIYCDAEDTVTLYFPTPLKGSGVLEIAYKRTVPNDTLHGIFALSNLEGEQLRYSIATQFKATGARTAFPCFDEPKYKANFSISVIAPKDRTVLSNMPLAETVVLNENVVKFVFATSPKMATYSTCILIGDYEYTEQLGFDGITPFRIYTPKGKTDQGALAMTVAIRALDYLQEYLGVNYSLPKLDIVTVSDFGPNAMESWGLLLFHEKALLVNEHSPISQRQLVTSLICHEIAHQWFGNLVTSQWWSHTWLNEGFANFFENLLMDKFFEQWDYGSLYLATQFSNSMDTDSLENSHPIMVKSVNGNNMDQAFGTIVFTKAGAIIRMIKEFIGEEGFKQWLGRYLDSYKYGTVETSDLLNSLKVAGYPQVANVMISWLNQKGHPTLNVFCARNRTSISSSVFTNNIIEQKPFSSQKHNIETEKYIWSIPVHYAKSATRSHSTALLTNEVETIRSYECISNWKVGSFGYYRVHHNSKSSKKLFKAVGRGSLTPIQRFSLQNDYFAFAKSGTESIVKYLKNLQYYKNEDQLYIWMSISRSLTQIIPLLSGPECFAGFKEYNNDLLSVIIQKLQSLEFLNDLDKSLVTLFYERLGKLKNENIVEHSKQMFEYYFNGDEELDADIRSAVLSIAAANADDETYDKFFQLFNRKRDNAFEREEILKAMASSRNSEQLKRLLNFSLTNYLTISEIITTISTVARGKPQTAWDFFKENFDYYTRITWRAPQSGKLIRAIVTSFKTEEKAKEIEQFFANNYIEGVDYTLKVSLEILRKKIEWIKRDSTAVCEYFKTLVANHGN